MDLNLTSRLEEFENNNKGYKVTEEDSKKIYRLLLSLVDSPEIVVGEFEKIVDSYVPYLYVLHSISFSSFREESIKGLSPLQITIKAIASFSLYLESDLTNLPSLILSFRYILTLYEQYI